MNYSKDLESGRGRQLYPAMTDSPDYRWAFIRKVYVILTVQLALTVAVAAVVVTIKSIPHFILHTKGGIALYILVVILPFILLFPLYVYHQWHPVNLLFLGLFTVSVSFLVGLTCAFTSGKVILESAVLTTAVFISLTIYTFWAAWRGHDFQFLGPFLFGSLLVLILFALIQVFFPLGKLSVMIYGGLAAIIFCGYIIYDTDNLIKRYEYDQYVWAAVALYLDVINLFVSLLTLLRETDS